MIGTILNKRYRIDTELGQGGMGTVYRAHDSVLNRDVAVKVLNKTDLGSEGRARLLQEARAVAQLNHPNIVTVYDAGQDGDSTFIIMELVEGESLQRQAPRGIDEIVSVAKELCMALEHAHEQGIIHRDLKPENVIVAADGTVKLMDFGLARSVASRMTSEGTIVGTVFYMAPELALGQAIDARTDLYALGIMLYELTTGQLPFMADDPIAVISQHVHAPIVPPRAHNEQIPPALDALIVRLMSKQPEERPRSALEVMQSLEHDETLASGAAITTASGLSLLDCIVRGKLVGRERELADATTYWQRAIVGEAQVLLISGEPGIGKTRLARELSTLVEVSGGTVLVGECYDQSGAPYAPLAQAVRAVLSNGFNPDTRGAYHLPNPVLAELLALVPDLRSLYPDVQPNPALESQAEQQRLFESVVSLCSALCDVAPLMLFIDDVQWADSGTLFLLRHLARRMRRRRFMLLATYREVELDKARPLHEMLLDLNRERLATRIKLSRFDRQQTHDLLTSMFAEEITSELLEGIYRETEGNPFFVEEICKALIENGKLTYEDGRWGRPPSIEELEIPQSLRVTVLSRVSKLSDAAQDTLLLAAILGREFDFETLLEASVEDEDTLIGALEEAARAQLIEEAKDKHGEVFTFAHGLIPSTLRESVSGLRRHRLHRRVAKAIETLRPNDYEALAYQYAEAGDEERAFTYYSKAGDHAADAYANQEAENYYRAALELVEAQRDRAHLISQLGRVLARRGHAEEAIQTWREGIELYRALGDSDGLARLYARSARTAWDGGDPPQGLKLCQEGLAEIPDRVDSEDMARLLHETARAYHFNGVPDEALPLCRQALEMAERMGAIEVQADALVTLGMLPNPSQEEQLQALTQAIELAESGGYLAVAARAHNNLAVTLGEKGEFRAGLDHYRRAAEMARQRGDVFDQHLYLSSVCGLLIFMGDSGAAQEILSTLRELQDATDSRSAAALGLSTDMSQAHYLRCQGDLLQALQKIQFVHDEYRQRGSLNPAFYATLALSEVLLELERVDEAAAILLEAVEISERGLGQSVVAYCRLSSALAAQQNIEEARRALDAAREGAGSSPIQWERRELLMADARLASAEGDCGAAMVAYEQTVEAVVRTGMRWYQARVLQEWAKAHLACGGVGDVERARALLKEALALFEEMDVPFYATQVQERLEALADAAPATTSE